ncbi:MAG: TetR/AcrR family transcriptional regulator [Candidatus Omnitrophica bacterium]|nr:TetR/AcrR family transcriptional regulator [Candidatus Omnitrophota bacterium]
MRIKQTKPKTKENLLDAAERLMRAKGFWATSVDEVCETAGVTKGCFFHYFESKEHLGKEVLKRYCCRSADAKQRWTAGVPEDPLKRVFRHVDFALRMAHKKGNSAGCLLGTFAQELCDTFPEIRRLCRDGFQSWSEDLKRDIAAAKKRYAPQARFDPSALADHFVAVLQGAQLVAKTRADSSVVVRSLEHYRDYLKRLFKKGGA